MGMDIYELIEHSAVLYCGIYNIYDKEKRILNKIRKVIEDVFPPLVVLFKENNEKISKAKVEHYCSTINDNMKEILTNVANISQLSEEVVEKVLHDISSVGLVSNDDVDNFESYDEKQKNVVLNFLKATKENSIKAFKNTYDNKNEYFRTIIQNLRNIHTTVNDILKTKKVDPFVITKLDKMKIDANELVQDIIDMGKPKENLLKKLNV